MDANMPKMKQNRSNCFDGNRVESVVKVARTVVV